MVLRLDIITAKVTRSFWIRSVAPSASPSPSVRTRPEYWQKLVKADSIYLGGGRGGSSNYLPLDSYLLVHANPTSPRVQVPVP